MRCCCNLVYHCFRYHWYQYLTAFSFLLDIAAWCDIHIE